MCFDTARAKDVRNWLNLTCNQLTIIREQKGRDGGAWRLIKTRRMGRMQNARRLARYKDGVDEGQLGSYRIKLSAVQKVSQAPRCPDGQRR